MTNNSLPLVSIVTPSYNQGPFIEATILSVKNQDYPNIEHIVVDGGSTDDTLRILTKYEKQYNLKWISERDKGQSDALNKGFARARGEVIGWLNSDDVYFDKQVITYVVNAFRKLPDIGVLYGDGVIMDENNLILMIIHTIPYFSYNHLLRSNLIFQPSSFFRREVIGKHKLDINMDLAMDYEYYLRISRNGVKFKHLNRLLSAFRSYRAAKSISRSQEMLAEGKKIRKLYGYDSDVSHHLFKLLDEISLAFLIKVYGAKTMIGLYTNPKKDDLAFPAKFDSLSKAIQRQSLPAKLLSHTTGC